MPLAVTDSSLLLFTTYSTYLLLLHQLALFVIVSILIFNATLLLFVVFCPIGQLVQ